MKSISDVMLEPSFLLLVWLCPVSLPLPVYLCLCQPPPWVRASTWLPVALPVRPTIYLSICERVCLRVVIRSCGCL